MQIKNAFNKILNLDIVEVKDVGYVLNMKVSRRKTVSLVFSSYKDAVAAAHAAKDALILMNNAKELWVKDEYELQY